MAMAWMDGNLYRHEREHASITSKHIIIFIDFMLEIDTIIIRWEILSAYSCMPLDGRIDLIWL